jgi:hypothetical protein
MDNLEQDAAFANSEPTAPSVAERDYWYVWREGSRYPKVKHTTFDIALTEAKRLATVAPTKIFKVMHCVAKVQM